MDPVSPQVRAARPSRAPAYTGRYLVALRKGATDAGLRMLEQRTGVRVARGLEYAQCRDLCAPEPDLALVFERLGIAVLNAHPGRIDALEFDATSPFLFAERERTFGLQPPSPPPQGDCHTTETELTWGLRVTGAAKSQYTGRGVGICVLDTGVHQTHPDLLARNVKSACFTGETSAQDTNGHGTHCAGTNGGPKVSSQPPRYGVAYESDLYVGKIFDDKVQTCDARMIAGIEWALNEGCSVVSMSLGQPVDLDTPYSRALELCATRALDANTLLIAAAGNGSNRVQNPPDLAPVDHPANCPSIMAVAALDECLEVMNQSNAGMRADGGQVDIAAPGTNVYSSWVGPSLFVRRHGTSMATPYVAGIAALYAQACPSARGRTLQALLLQNALRLPLPSRDVGVGLVRAP